ncbi:MAG: hypothetical protein ABI831_04850 [Betaproteobacteria bacterium]
MLVSGVRDFDHATFLALCGSIRGMQIKAFDQYDLADEWLAAQLPPDQKLDAAAA